MTAANLIPLLAPDFSNDPRLSIAIELAAGEVRDDHPYLDRVVALIAAHILTMANRRGSGGAVTGASEGGLSMSFAPIGDIGQLGSTAYGQEVHRLNLVAYGTAVMVV